ncbi:MAG: hypothetical protein IT183_06310 [Acidobacteria bacterium]|nr:hypothetical protein [Acidobacteriota bacterium]
MTTFEQWARDVDVLCVKHLCCTWADLAGDSEPLERSFTSGEMPRQFVRWWAEKYGLVWVEGLHSADAPVR